MSEGFAGTFSLLCIICNVTTTIACMLITRKRLYGFLKT